MKSVAIKISDKTYGIPWQHSKDSVQLNACQKKRQATGRRCRLQAEPDGWKWADAAMWLVMPAMLYMTTDQVN